MYSMYAAYFYSMFGAALFYHVPRVCVDVYKRAHRIDIGVNCKISRACARACVCTFLLNHIKD